MKREYRGLSKRTQRLLAMPEGIDVDFKRDVTGVHGSDLVAFANSLRGGTLLIGIDEYTTEDGVQRGQICGCDVDDNARLTLVNKATGCFPNVDLDIYIENLSATPILRVEIPSGPVKPYCTQGGQYSIRADGRNRALYPEELLSIFMDREGEQFLSRFRHAVNRLEHQVGGIGHTLSEGMLDVSHHIHDLDDQLKRTLTHIGRLTDSTKKRSRNLMQTLKESQDSISNLERELLTDSSQKQRITLLREIAGKLEQVLVHIENESNGDS